MLDTDALLALLDERKIRNADIARALGLPDSRIPEIKTKRRALKLDEAAKLVRAFELEEGREVKPLPAPVTRLLVRYLADQLGVHPDEARIASLSEDMRAFASFVSDRQVRQSIDAAEGFFRALRFRHSDPAPEPEAEAPQETDPHLED